MSNQDNNSIISHVNNCDPFFKRLENGTSLEECMDYEWARLRSFESFIHVANFSPIILSRLGFFYTGKDSEVKCFSCGARYSLCSGDNISEVHRLISPDCRYLTGNNDSNVPVAHRNEAQQAIEGSPNLGTQYQQIQNASTVASRLELATRNDQQPSGQEDRPLPPQNPNDARYSHERESTITSTEQMRQLVPQVNVSVNRIGQSGVSSATMNKLSPLGVNFEKPRYPQYAVLTVRIKTYNEWPATQSPRKMAEAGFIYAGYADYTRCFFCGGGLRNWTEGDDPWIEHARWFPRCAHVRQNKGVQFVHLVHQRLEEMMKSENGLSMSQGNEMQAENNLFLSQRNEMQAENNLFMSQKNEIQAPTEPNLYDPNSTESNANQQQWLRSLPSYESVLDLGYDPDLIENAIHQLLKHGKTDFNSADILKLIFNMEEGSSQEEILHCKQTTSNYDSNGSPGAISLLEENRRLREQRLCMICVEKDSCIAFLPCGHLVCCEDCAPAMRKCPKCKQIVQGSIKTWLV